AKRTDRVAHGADLQLCDLAVRRVARAGVGRDAGADDARFGDKHCRPFSDAQEILRLMPVQTEPPKIQVREQHPASVANTGRPAKVSVHDLNFFYGRVQALHNISIDIPERVVMAFIGPSGCGKSTFLRTLNRMNDVIPATRVAGQVLIDDHDIYAPGTDVVEL